MHRNPVPALIACAMMSLAVAWKWLRVAAVIGLSFHGVARVGEPLGAMRSCLLLPCDTLEEENSALYVRVEKPKTSNRGGGRVQHLRGQGAQLRALCAQGVRGDAPGDPLFGASPSAFRRRWDKLLAAFGIPANLRLLPGGLPGGGAVHLYQRQVPLTEIMWGNADSPYEHD